MRKCATKTTDQVGEVARGAVEEIERTARSKHLNLHQAMRAALLGWIRRTG